MVSITVKTLQQKQFKVEAEPTDTVADLKSKIEQSQGHPVSNQKLVYSGKILTDDKTVGDCNIKEKDFLVLMVSKPKAAPAASTSAAATSSSTPAATSSAIATDDTVPPPAPVPAPSEPAQTSTGDSATPTSATSTANVPAFGDLSSFVTGDALQTSVNNMVEMGFPKEDVLKALKASFNNPDRAVDYLMNGIPAHLLAEGSGGPSTAAAGTAAPAAPSGAQPATATATVPATGGAAQGNVTVVDSTPQNLFQAAAAQATGRGAGGGSALGGGAAGGAAGRTLDLSALRESPMFAQIQQMVTQNPALLQPLVQQLAASQPGLAQALNEHPEILYELMSGIAGGDGMDDGDDPMGEGGPIPPGAHVVSVTAEERAAIDRLVALGFPQQAAIEAYFACDKNEELAANFLFQGGFD